MRSLRWLLLLGLVECAISATIRANERPTSMMNMGQKPNPEQLAFFSHTTCAQKCMINCQPIMAENQNTFFICPRLKPPEKTLSERFIAGASWPWILFLSVLGFSILFCIFCMFCRCCCRTGRSRRSDHSSREPLAVDRRIEEIISDHVENGHPAHHCRGERISGSKYVVDV